MNQEPSVLMYYIGFAAMIAWLFIGWFTLTVATTRLTFYTGISHWLMTVISTFFLAPLIVYIFMAFAPPLITGNPEPLLTIAQFIDNQLGLILLYMVVVFVSCADVKKGAYEGGKRAREARKKNTQ